MRLAMIRNIVFDMGNVMIRFDPGYFITREGITDPADRKLVMNELFQSVEWAQMDSGVLTEETAEMRLVLEAHHRSNLFDALTAVAKCNLRRTHDFIAN